MKRILNFCIALIPALVMTAIGYGFMAFIKLDLDCRNWSETSRIILCVLCGIFWMIGYSIMGVKEFWDEKDKK